MTGKPIMLEQRTISRIQRMKSHDYSIRGIARRLEISTNTVAKYLRDPTLANERRINRIPRLAPCYQYLAQLIEEDPGISGTVAFRNARDKGFKIGQSTVNRFLSKQRGKHLFTLHRKIRIQTTKAHLLRCMTAGNSYVDVLAKYIREKAGSLELALTEEDRAAVIEAGRKGRYKIWRQGVAIDMSGSGINGRQISNMIDISSNTLRRIMDDYQKQEFTGLFQENPIDTETEKRKDPASRQSGYWKYCTKNRVHSESTGQVGPND